MRLCCLLQFARRCDFLPPQKGPQSFLFHPVKICGVGGTRFAWCVWRRCDICSRGAWSYVGRRGQRNRVTLQPRRQDVNETHLNSALSRIPYPSLHSAPSLQPRSVLPFPTLLSAQDCQLQQPPQSSFLRRCHATNVHLFASGVWTSLVAARTADCLAGIASPPPRASAA